MKHQHIKKKDQVLLELKPNASAVIRRTFPLDRNYLQALNTTMKEWESEEDEQAYENLSY